MSELGLVKDFMAKKLITFKPDDDVNYVIDKMLEHNISGAPVIDEKGDLLGLVSEKDCMAMVFGKYHQELTFGSISEIMKSDVKTVFENDSVHFAAIKIIDTHFRRFPVLNKSGKLVGQISCKDVLRAIRQHKEDKK